MIGGEFAEISTSDDLVGWWGDVVSLKEQEIDETVTACIIRIIIHSSLHIFRVYASAEIGISAWHKRVSLTAHLEIEIRRNDYLVIIYNIGKAAKKICTFPLKISVKIKMRVYVSKSDAAFLVEKTSESADPVITGTPPLRRPIGSFGKPEMMISKSWITLSA